MKTRNVYLAAGLLALFLSGPILAHDLGHDTVYPVGNWSGNVTLWGGSQGHSGWSANLGFGTIRAYPAAYAPAVPLPLAHRHLASCHHAPPGHYAHHHGKGHKHGRGHGKGHFGRHSGHH
jgi:hypothetical protein